MVDITDRLANSGKIVIVSALDGDYHRKVRVKRFVYFYN